MSLGGCTAEVYLGTNVYFGHVIALQSALPYKNRADSEVNNSQQWLPFLIPLSITINTRALRTSSSTIPSLPLFFSI